MKNKIMGGAFILARQTFESDIWTKKPATWFKIWVYIIGKTNHKDKTGFKRGEHFFNFTQELRDIGSDITYDMVRHSMTYFKKSGMISTTKSTRGIVIKVLKYEDYQTLDNYSSTTPSTTEAQQKHNRSTTIHKNDKNEKNIADKKSATKTPPEEKFNQKEYIDGMKKKKQAHIRFIGWYFEKRKSNFPTKESIQIETKRWLKDASFIVKYPQIKVSKAYELVRQKYPDEWNMSTIRKVISEA